MSAAPTMTVSRPSERELCFTRAFRAPRALVFETFTKPEWLARWMIARMLTANDST